jgi:hypothetical protein
LASLLIQHINKVELQTHVVLVVGWPNESKGYANGYQWLKQRGWTFQDGAVLVLDSAQGSYWDKVFWNNNKAIGPGSLYRLPTMEVLVTMTMIFLASPHF